MTLLAFPGRPELGEGFVKGMRPSERPCGCPVCVRTRRAKTGMPPNVLYIDPVKIANSQRFDAAEVGAKAYRASRAYSGLRFREPEREALPEWVEYQLPHFQSVRTPTWGMRDAQEVAETLGEMVSHQLSTQKLEAVSAKRRERTSQKQLITDHQEFVDEMLRLRKQNLRTVKERIPFRMKGQAQQYVGEKRGVLLER
jgi:hypothetical protein